MTPRSAVDKLPIRNVVRGVFGLRYRIVATRRNPEGNFILYRGPHRVGRFLTISEAADIAAAAARASGPHLHFETFAKPPADLPGPGPKADADTVRYPDGRCGCMTAPVITIEPEKPADVGGVLQAMADQEGLDRLARIRTRHLRRR